MACLPVTASGSVLSDRGASWRIDWGLGRAYPLPRQQLVSATCSTRLRSPRLQLSSWQASACSTSPACIACPRQQTCYPRRRTPAAGLEACEWEPHSACPKHQQARLAPESGHAAPGMLAECCVRDLCSQLCRPAAHLAACSSPSADLRGCCEPTHQTWTPSFMIMQHCMHADRLQPCNQGSGTASPQS